MGDFLYFMLQSSLLILLVYVTGKAGQKSLSARARYGLWLLPLVRLLLPFFLVPVSWPGSWSIPHPYTVLQETIGRGPESAAGLSETDAGLPEEDSGQQSIGQSIADNMLRLVSGQSGPVGIDMTGAASGSEAGSAMAGSEAGSAMTGSKAAGAAAGSTAVSAASGNENYGVEGAQTAPQDAMAAVGDAGQSPAAQYAVQNGAAAAQSLIPLLLILWAAGCLFTGSVLIVQNVRFFKNVRRGAVRVEVPDARGPQVFYRKNLESPCLAGLFHPRIYVNDKSLYSPETLKMVILHERMHARQKEPVWNFFRNLLCVIYWFHPFVWLGALASRRDAELACDEGVILDMDKAERRRYGMVLLELASEKRMGILQPATAINGGKKEIAARIRTIAKRRKTRKGVFAAVLVLLLAVGTVGCTRVETSGNESMSGGQADGASGDDGRAWADGASGENDPAQEDALETQQESGESADTRQDDAGREEKIVKREALFSEATVLGVDGPQLDYVDDEIVIFHEYFGLVIYQYADRDGDEGEGIPADDSFVPGIIDTMDLSSIGCSATQGDYAAAVRVSKDGKQVYIHAMSSQDFYRYDRIGQELYQCSMDLWPAEESLYELPESPEGSTYFNIYDMKDWEIGKVTIKKWILGQEEDAAVWTEKSSGYMRALRERFDEDEAGLVVDEGWNGGYRFDPETAEDLGKEEGRWYKLVCQVDEGGNKVDNPYEQTAWFVSVDGKAYLSVRRFDELICSWEDMLIYSYDDTVYVTKNDVIDPFFSLKKGKDRVSFHAQDNVLCISNETAGTMTFYDEELQVIREYRDVRLADFSENRYCVLDLNTGLYGYLNGFGVEAIPFQYSVAQGFHNGYAVVLAGAEAEVYYEEKTVKMFNHVGGCWGVIDTAGNYVIEPSEEFSNSFDREDLAGLTQPDLVDGPVTFSPVDERGHVKFIVREDGRVLMEGWIAQ